MGIFKTRQNKKFSYTPRHFDDKGEGNPYEIKHKFDEYRKTVGSAGLKTKFNNAMDDLKSPADKQSKRIIMIVSGILILLFLYIIDFDLSIFFR